MTTDEWARAMRSIRAGSGSTWADASRIAFHEAAHGVVMVFEGVGLGVIALDLAGDPMDSPRSTLHVAGGHCTQRVTGRPTTARVWAAGFCGETMAGYPARPVGAIPRSYDHQQARIDDPGFDPFRAADEARRILRPCWVAVCKLAEALLERGELDGLEAEKIVRDNLPVSVRDELKLWGDPPPPPRQPWEDEADAFLAHFWQHGHMNLADERDVEDINAELLAKYPSLADPKYKPGTPENAETQERAARAYEEATEQLEAIYPGDRTPLQQAYLDWATLDDEASSADRAEVNGRIDRILAEQQEADRRRQPGGVPQRVDETRMYAAIIRECDEIVKQRGGEAP